MHFSSCFFPGNVVIAEKTTVMPGTVSQRTQHFVQAYDRPRDFVCIFALKFCRKQEPAAAFAWRLLEKLVPDAPLLSTAVKKYISLPVDHFTNASTEKFNNKYYIDDSFWDKVNGPIFFEMVGVDRDASHSARCRAARLQYWVCLQATSSIWR